MEKEEDKALEEDSMEDILHSIRDIVSGEGEEDSQQEETKEMAEEAKTEEVEEDDVLELTEVSDEEEPAAAKEEGDAPAKEEASTPAEEPAEATEEPATEDAASAAEEAATPDDTAAPAEKADPSANEEVQEGAEPPATEGDVLEEIDDALEEEATETTAEESTPDAEVTDEGSEKNDLVSDAAAKEATDSMKGLIDNIPQPDIESPEFRSGSNVEDLVIEALKPMLSEWLSENLPVIVKQIVEKEVKKLIPREE